MSRINNTQIYSAHDIDAVMPMYNSIEYWIINVAKGNLVDFNAANITTDSFQIKEKITGQISNKILK